MLYVYRNNAHQFDFDDVAFVEVEDSGGVKRYAVDQTRKIFVLGAYGSPAQARLLDSLGAPDRWTRRRPSFTDDELRDMQVQSGGPSSHA